MFVISWGFLFKSNFAMLIIIYLTIIANSVTC